MTRWNMAAINALYGSGKPPKARSRKSGSKVAGGCESESSAQKRLLIWIDETLPDVLYHASPNGAKRSASVTNTLLILGMRKGWPDIEFMEARRGYHGLFIELKKQDRIGGLSLEQKDCLDKLNARGYYAICCHGFDQAKERIEWYFGIDG